MGTVRIGPREFERLQHVHQNGHLLVPGDRGAEWDLLVRKGLVKRTESRGHNTLKSGIRIVDVWRIDLTPLAMSIIRSNNVETPHATSCSAVREELGIVFREEGTA